MSQPAIILAMQPSRTQHVLPDEVLRRLGGIGRLLDSKPWCFFFSPFLRSTC